MLNWLKETTAAARKGIAEEVGRFRNRTFMEAIANACAMMAVADGRVDAAEKQKMAGFMQRSEELKVFDMAEVIPVFNKAIEHFEFDVAIGRAEALKKIAKIKGNADQARLLVRVACTIGASDGTFDEAEKETARMMVRELGLSLKDFDL
jgi:tellurite resistance protein TerB